MRRVINTTACQSVAVLFRALLLFVKRDTDLDRLSRETGARRNRTDIELIGAVT